MHTPPFVMEKRQNGLNIIMHPSLSLVDRAVDEVKAFCRSQDLSHALFAIIITMREGLTNAVRHGAPLSPGDSVRFTLRVTDATIHMEFEDSGPGFDWKTRIHTQSATDSEGGRGIEIMRKYCHDVVYSKQGARLSIIIRPKRPG